MNPAKQSKMAYSRTIFILSAASFFLPYIDLKAQCTINTPSPIQGCNGSITFNATSMSTTVNHHIWYDQYLNPLSPTTENKIEYQPGTGQVAWVSTLTVALTGNATFYVAASCNTSDKRSVTFTSQNGAPISLSMSPASNPSDLCAGETITLTAGNGSNFQWRFNNPNDPSYTGGTTKTATQSGTYYLSGYNSCNIWQSNSITLNFQQPMSNIAISGGASSICQGTTSSQYSAGGFNYNSVVWSISDNDPNANATISSTGLVTWNGIAGQATISMTAYGCHGTSIAAPQRDVTIIPQPTLAQCAISNASNITSCGGAVTLSATSTSSFVTSHKWFTSQSGGSQVGVTRQYSPNSGAWVSELDGNFTESTTYWAEPQCDCGMVGTRVPVVFTKTTPSIIGLAMNPASNPSQLCAGESVTLTASGGSAYEWRLNDPNKTTPDFSGTSITPTESGIYYLRGVNSCNAWGENSINITFRQPLSNITISGPDSFCQATPSTQFNTEGFNFDAVTWSITDTDPNASATIGSTGLVAWNSIATDATITMVAYGCHGTTETRTKTILVDRSPYQLQVNTPQADFCQGTVFGTQFTATGNNIHGFAWDISGTGNTISNSGHVTWDEAFSGQATITAYAGGCNGSVTPVTTTITVYPEPTVTVSPSGDVEVPFGTPSIQLTATGSGNVYQWLRNTGPLQGATSTSYDVISTGSYSIRVTSEHGCTTVSDPVNVMYQSNYNYIIENILQTDRHESGMPITEIDIQSLPVEKRLKSTQFFDGLGQGMQTVSLQASPLRLDVVQPIVLDAFGRESFKYLPVTLQQNGTYKEQIIDKDSKAYINEALPFYSPGSGNAIADDFNPYAQTVFEPSPLNRILKQGAPGTTWQPNADPLDMNDNTIKKRYEANTAQEVFFFKYDLTTESITLSEVENERYYQPKELYANKTYDEHNNEVIEYVDKEGRTVCKKVQHDTVGGVAQYASTYYIYDDVGNLVVVLPPEAVKEIVSN